jgi:hypothetical protein
MQNMHSARTIPGLIKGLAFTKERLAISFSKMVVFTGHSFVTMQHLLASTAGLRLPNKETE